MIFITGDCHMNYSKFAVRNFFRQKGLTKNDYVIVCGDFGLWEDSAEQEYLLTWLANKPFTTLFIDGNHENFDLLNSYDVETWNGGKVHKINDSVIHLMRGQVFDIDGIKFFTFGGAQSHDIQDGIIERDEEGWLLQYKLAILEGKYVRVNHLSWWKEELPSNEECLEGLQNLAKHNNKVDVILTHCAPTSIKNSVFNYNDYDACTEYLDKIKNAVEFKRWYFGHYHKDMKIDDRYSVLYHKIEELDI